MEEDHFKIYTMVSITYTHRAHLRKRITKYTNKSSISRIHAYTYIHVHLLFIMSLHVHVMCVTCTCTAYMYCTYMNFLVFIAQATGLNELQIAFVCRETLQVYTIIF